MRPRYRLLHLLARGVCLVRGHRFVYRQAIFGGVRVVSRLCSRCRHADQSAALSVRSGQHLHARPRAGEQASA